MFLSKNSLSLSVSDSSLSDRFFSIGNRFVRILFNAVARTFLMFLSLCFRTAARTFVLTLLTILLKRISLWSSERLPSIFESSPSNAAPSLVWDFHSLLLGIQMMLSFMLTDEHNPMRVCKKCSKFFVASRPSAVFCSPRCKNQYNVYKNRAKNKTDETEE